MAHQHPETTTDLTQDVDPGIVNIWTLNP